MAVLGEHYLCPAWVVCMTTQSPTCYRSLHAQTELLDTGTMLISARDSQVSVQRLQLNTAEPRLSLICRIPLCPGKPTKAAELRWATWASDSSAVLLVYSEFDPTYPRDILRSPQARLTSFRRD